MTEGLEAHNHTIIGSLFVGHTNVNQGYMKDRLSFVKGGKMFFVDRVISHNQRISVRDNLANMYDGQEMIFLKFKENKEIPNSKIIFKDKLFTFEICGVPISESKSLKEMYTYLQHILKEI